MNQPRESIANALFSVLQNAYPWQTASRRAQEYSNVCAQPAMFLVSSGETATQQTFGLTKWTLLFHALIYFQADSSPGTIPDQTMNAILDAIDSAMLMRPGEHHTLGNLVTNAWIDGQIMIAGGVLDPQCVLVVPIKVLA